MEPDVGSESRFLLTPPAFDAALGGFRRDIANEVYGLGQKNWNGVATRR